MDPEGALIALVVSVQLAADGAWQVVLGEPQMAVGQIAAAHFVLRMWRGQNGVLRGTIRRQGSDVIAPFQCNEQMQQMLSEWLNI